ncbi:ribonuclease H-like YkuK family protein [Cohnella nanjingensis]|uniref:Ribonuclease H-like YkuK family protein n=1 Tax=Cohnella nanjingensis TaxID=1387779 RepID=A0A7X0RTW5_9BACL|nr:ribonuclease H-like YkuK family protein [Cohnella nanjingensis]MBB6673622.1 ribonuclease H-like YkuK family protein [Cohnella nanjingensis]
MRKIQNLKWKHDMTFHNVSERRLSLDQVHDRILRFMNQDPRGSYNLMIGTDCQVFPGYTNFITGIVIQRKGKGAWACYRQVILPRELLSIKEKLSLETSYSEEIALHLIGDRLAQMENVVLPYVYQGATFDAYIDVDAGTDPAVSKTAAYVEDMRHRVEAVGMKARLKPDAVIASAYANRYTKRPGKMQS